MISVRFLTFLTFFSPSLVLRRWWCGGKKW
jgi:hypothetical protein